MLHVPKIPNNTRAKDVTPLRICALAQYLQISSAKDLPLEFVPLSRVAKTMGNIQKRDHSFPLHSHLARSRIVDSNQFIHC